MTANSFLTATQFRLFPLIQSDWRNCTPIFHLTKLVFLTISKWGNAFLEVLTSAHQYRSSRTYGSFSISATTMEHTPNSAFTTPDIL